MDKEFECLIDWLGNVAFCPSKSGDIVKIMRKSALTLFSTPFSKLFCLKYILFFTGERSAALFTKVNVLIQIIQGNHGH